MKKRYVNLILAMASASVLVLGSVPAMAKTDETKTESGEEAEASEEKDTDAAKCYFAAIQTRVAAVGMS